MTSCAARWAAARSDPHHKCEIRDERGFCYGCGTREDGTRLVSQAELDQSTYYRNVFTVEVLSDKPLSGCGLDELHYLTTDGECSGMTVQTVTNEKLSESEMCARLIAQGSDPDFLIPTEGG